MPEKTAHFWRAYSAVITLAFALYVCADAQLVPRAEGSAAEESANAFVTSTALQPLPSRPRSPLLAVTAGTRPADNFDARLAMKKVGDQEACVFDNISNVGMKKIKLDARLSLADVKKYITLSPDEEAKLMDMFTAQSVLTERELPEEIFNAEWALLPTLEQIVGIDRSNLLSDQRENGFNDLMEVQTKREALYLTHALGLPAGREEEIANALQAPDRGTAEQIVWYGHLMQLTPQQETKLRAHLTREIDEEARLAAYNAYIAEHPPTLDQTELGDDGWARFSAHEELAAMKEFLNPDQLEKLQRYLQSGM